MILVKGFEVYNFQVRNLSKCYYKKIYYFSVELIFIRDINLLKNL